ncbi:MAG: hypothetical protein AAGH15_00155 [Myxococcota bacterium]
MARALPALLLLIGCLGSHPNPVDVGDGGSDAGPGDAGFPDADAPEDAEADGPPADASPEDTGVEDAGDAGVVPRPIVIDRRDDLAPPGPMPPSRCGLERPLDLDGDGVPFLAETFVELPPEVGAFSEHSAGPGASLVLPSGCDECALVVDELGVTRYEGVRVPATLNVHRVTAGGTAWISGRSSVTDDVHFVHALRCGATRSWTIRGGTRLELRPVAGRDEVFLVGDDHVTLARPDGTERSFRDVLHAVPLPSADRCADGVTGDLCASAMALSHGAAGRRALALLEEGDAITLLREQRQLEPITAWPPEQGPWFCAQAAPTDAPVELVRPEAGGRLSRWRLGSPDLDCAEVVTAQAIGGHLWALTRGGDGNSLRLLRSDAFAEQALPASSPNPVLYALPGGGVGVMQIDAANPSAGRVLRGAAAPGSMPTFAWEGLGRGLFFHPARDAAWATRREGASVLFRRIPSADIEMPGETLPVTGPVGLAFVGELFVIRESEGTLTGYRTTGSVEPVPLGRAPRGIGRLDVGEGRALLVVTSSETCQAFEWDGADLRRVARAAGCLREFGRFAPSDWLLADVGLGRLDGDRFVVADPDALDAPFVWGGEDDAGVAWFQWAGPDDERGALYQVDDRSLLLRVDGAGAEVGDRQTYPIFRFRGSERLCILGPGPGRCEALAADAELLERTLVVGLDGRASARARAPSSAGDATWLWRSQLPPRE